jgi:hypothetical protein
LPGAITQAWFR